MANQKNNHSGQTPCMPQTRLQRRSRFARISRAAVMEAMEPRILFSTYQFHTVATFDTTAGGGDPSGAVTFDSAGNLFGTTTAGGTSGDGTVFKIAKGSTTVTTVATFNGVNGFNPEGAVAFDSSGNLFGTTIGGGTSGDGTVFEIAKGATKIKDIVNFNGANGMTPYAVTFDASGNLFGTALAGGAHSDGTVFEIAKGATTLTTVATFNLANGATPVAVNFDSGGNLFGTTYVGGASGDGTVFEIAKGSRTLTTVITFNYANGAHPFSGVVFDSSGNLFGATSAGGPPNVGTAEAFGTVFEIAKGSKSLTALATFNYGEQPEGIKLDSSGNLFGITFHGGANGNGTVFEIAKGAKTITTLFSFNGADVAQFAGAITIDSSGNLFGTTYATVFEITKVPPLPPPLTLVSFNGLNGNDPSAAVTFDSAGDLFGTTYSGGPGSGQTSGAGTVFEIAKGATTFTIVASFNDATGNGPQAAVTFDSSGNLFGTTDFGGTNDAGTVFEIIKGSKIIITVASFNNADGAQPQSGVTFDSAGNLFGTTDGGGSSDYGTVFEIKKGSKTITTVANFNSADRGTSSVSGVTFDSSGNLFGTTESGGGSADGTVFEIAKGSKTLRTVATFDGPNGEYPNAAVTFDSSGNLFGTTSSEGDFGSDGAIFTIAKGSTTITTVAVFSGDNGAHPEAAVTFDSSGNLFGTTSQGGDSGDGTIFEIAKGTTALATVATFDGADGNYPNAIAFDSKGNIFGTTAGGGKTDNGTVFELVRGGTVRVAVTAPAAQTATAGVAKSVALGAFTESGATGPFSVTVNWGDGSAATKLTQAAAGIIAPKSHIFGKAGVDIVSVTITDAKGHVSNAGSFKVTVSP